MISQTSADQLVQSLERLRVALGELAFMVTDFQFEYDVASRQWAAQQTGRILDEIRREPL